MIHLLGRRWQIASATRRSDPTHPQRDRRTVRHPDHQASPGTPATGRDGRRAGGGASTGPKPATTRAMKRPSGAHRPSAARGLLPVSHSSGLSCR